jgi:hypothetical protein
VQETSARKKKTRKPFHSRKPEITQKPFCFV